MTHVTKSVFELQDMKTGKTANSSGITTEKLKISDGVGYGLVIHIVNQAVHE